MRNIKESTHVGVKGSAGPISKHHIMYRQSGSDKCLQTTNHLNIFHLEKNLTSWQSLNCRSSSFPLQNRSKSGKTLLLQSVELVFASILDTEVKARLQIFSYPISFLAER